MLRPLHAVECWNIRKITSTATESCHVLSISFRFYFSRTTISTFHDLTSANYGFKQFDITRPYYLWYQLSVCCLIWMHSIQAALKFSWIMMENGHTYFENLAVFTPQDFKNMFDHFSSLCMKEFQKLSVLVHLIMLPIDLQMWVLIRQLQFWSF